MAEELAGSGRDVMTDLQSGSIIHRYLSRITRSILSPAKRRRMSSLGCTIVRLTAAKVRLAMAAMGQPRNQGRRAGKTRPAIVVSVDELTLAPRENRSSSD